MAVLEDVEKLIVRISPEPICDDCITKKLNLSIRQHANQKTREMAGENGYRRSKDICSICEATRLVISKT